MNGDNGVIAITSRIVPDAYGCLQWRLLLLAAVLLLSGFFEGLGLAMLFPVLAKLGMGNAAVDGLPRLMEQGLAALGIPNELGVLLAAAVFVLYLQLLFQTWKAWCEADCQTRYTAHWHQRIFDAFMDAEWKFFISGRAASRVSVITNEAGRIAAAFYLLEQMLTGLVFIVIYGIVAMAASWQMVVFLCVFGIIIYNFVRPLSKKGHTIGTQVTSASETLQHRAMEFIQSAKLIKSTATEIIAKRYLADASEDYRAAYRLALFHPRLIYAVYMVAGYALLGAGTWLAVERLKVDPTAVAVSIYVFLRLYIQITNFQQNRQALLLSAPALEMAESQLAEARELMETAGGRQTLPSGPAGLRLQDICVRYGDLVALQDMSFEIAPAEIIGVTGGSGAGKSTLVDVIVGLVKPNSGKVEVDQILMSGVSRTDWRRSIGYVGQETLLLNGTVRANIAWGSEATEQEILTAARAANAHDFIAALPMGYATEIGDRGLRLSGGQRQRLGLARALVGSKRLLILDEATSALDSESENEIVSALQSMRERVTMVMVAHRLSTLRMANRILVLDGGRLVQAGTWEELASQKGVFARLLSLQRSPEEYSALTE